MEKCSAAEMISRLAMATSSRRPVTMNTGSSPRTGVLMYVLVLALNALILQPGHEEKRQNKNKIRTEVLKLQKYKVQHQHLRQQLTELQTIPLL